MKLRSPETTMTIEGRPVIENTLQDEAYWQQQYISQRKERLSDAVHDYLDDADTTIFTFYNDLVGVVTEMDTYHKTFAEKAVNALLLLRGKPVVEKAE
jgi:hypothetical protein